MLFGVERAVGHGGAQVSQEHPGTPHRAWDLGLGRQMIASDLRV